MKKLTLLLGLAVFLGASLPAFAVLGPVRVELRRNFAIQQYSRANTILNYKIFIRFNENLKEYNWLKVWFPTNESADFTNSANGINKICNGFPEINERIIDPRFVPNDKYFEKYDNPELKGRKQLYKAIIRSEKFEYEDCPELKNLGNWENACEDGSLLIKDPSGLGAWLLGTVLPSMPVEKEVREKLLTNIVRRVSIYYGGCSEECDNIEIVNNCRERSILYKTSSEIEPWRKGYNVIDWNFYNIVTSSAIPGRYKLAVATQAEPEPVESESYVLNCSSVSNIAVEVMPYSDRNKLMDVHFTTGEGGALDKKVSDLTIAFPDNVIFPDRILRNTVLVNGIELETEPVVAKHKDRSVVKMILPMDVSSFDNLTVTFLRKTNIQLKPSWGKFHISVSTSSEPQAVVSEELSFNPRIITRSDPCIELMPCKLEIVSVIPSGIKLTNKNKLVISFPNEFKIFKNIPSHKLIINGKTLVNPLIIKGNEITAILPKLSENFIDVQFDIGAGITNPPKGEYNIKLSFEGKELDVMPLIVRESVPIIKNLFLSDNGLGKVSKYSFDYFASTVFPVSRYQKLKITFPIETQMPSDSSQGKIMFGKREALSWSIQGSNLFIESPTKLTFEKSVSITIDIGIRNPTLSKNYCLKVSREDEKPSTSEEYALKQSDKLLLNSLSNVHHGVVLKKSIKQGHNK